MSLDEASAKRYARKSEFLEFCDHRYGLDDLKTAPLERW
jgi:hypothetical protein